MEPRLFCGITAAVLTLVVWSDFVRAESEWLQTYQCGAFEVTVQRYGSGNNDFSYDSRSRDLGSIFIKNGSRRNTGRSWVYAFLNGVTIYEIEDIWGNPPANYGSANLTVTQGNSQILYLECEK